MLWHNFKYSLRVLIRNRFLIFWTFIFPIILGFLFNLAFSDIEKNESLDIFDIGVVETEGLLINQRFKDSLEYLSNKERLFNINYVDEEEAASLLDKKEIVGYLYLDDQINLVIHENGIYETVLKTVVEEIKENIFLMDNISFQMMNKNIQEKQEVDFNQIYENIENRLEAVHIEDISKKNISYTMIEYYTLIAMACLYGGILGSVIMKNNLANMGSIGKRNCITPIPKLKLILGGVLASYLVQIIGVFLLLLVTIFCFNVDYGSNILGIILLILVGSLAGLSIGICVSTLVKGGDNIKTGIILAVTMFGCFLSGMMGITMKYIVDSNAPIINKVNPASMITDGFYALYYYDNMGRFVFNIVSLVIFSFILIFGAFLVLRRQRYDSI